MNCNPLCKYINGGFYGQLRRFHLTCLTCWLRRYNYGLVDKAQFRRVKTLVVQAESQNKHGIIIPRNYVAYFLLIDKKDSPGPRWTLRNAIIKNLLTVAEFFAQL